MLHVRVAVRERHRERAHDLVGRRRRHLERRAARLVQSQAGGREGLTEGAHVVRLHLEVVVDEQAGEDVHVGDGGVRPVEGLADALGDGVAVVVGDRLEPKVFLPAFEEFPAHGHNPGSGVTSPIGRISFRW